MNKISSVATGGAVVSITTLTPLVVWALDGFKQPVPDTVPPLIAGAILTIGHALYNKLTKDNNEIRKTTPETQPSNTAAG